MKKNLTEDLLGLVILKDWQYFLLESNIKTFDLIKCWSELSELRDKNCESAKIWMLGERVCMWDE